MSVSLFKIFCISVTYTFCIYKKKKVKDKGECTLHLYNTHTHTHSLNQRRGWALMHVGRISPREHLLHPHIASRARGSAAALPHRLSSTKTRLTFTPAVFTETHQCAFSTTLFVCVCVCIEWALSFVSILISVCVCVCVIKPLARFEERAEFRTLLCRFMISSPCILFLNGNTFCPLIFQKDSNRHSSGSV